LSAISHLLPNIIFSTSYYRGAMGIMLVYDITNEKSFENIVKWLRNIDEVSVLFTFDNFYSFPIYPSLFCSMQMRMWKR